MSIYISHQGMFNDGGTPFALEAALIIPVAQQALFAHYGKLGARTTVQGQIKLAQPGDVVMGAFVDISPKGDTCTIETEGYEWIYANIADVAVGDLVTVGADGVLVKIAAPVVADLISGVWQVDTIDYTVGATKVLIRIDSRL